MAANRTSSERCRMSLLLTRRHEWTVLVIPGVSNPKLQVPNPNDIPTPKFQLRPHLGFGAWDLGFDTQESPGQSTSDWQAGDRRAGTPTKAILQSNCVVSQPGHPRHPSAVGTRDSQDRPAYRWAILACGLVPANS